MSPEIRFLIVIPSRFESERLPGKPLLPILGKSLILRVCEQLKHLPHKIVVATDHHGIYEHVTESGYQAVLTSTHHENGTSRCIECAEILESEGFSYDVLINVQGDEPLINPAQLEEISHPFNQFPTMEIATLARKTTNSADRLNPNVVKVVSGKSKSGFSKALYFSRSPIPYQRDAVENSETPGYRHVGIYAFRKEILPTIKSLKPGILEQIEKLEQLRWLESGLEIGIMETQFENIGVDTPDDILVVENFLKNTLK